MNEREEERIWEKVENMTLKEIKQEIVKLNEVIQARQEIINKMGDKSYSDNYFLPLSCKVFIKVNYDK